MNVFKISSLSGKRGFVNLTALIAAPLSSVIGGYEGSFRVKSNFSGAPFAQTSEQISTWERYT
jgi:hypothetical protein